MGEMDAPDSHAAPAYRPAEFRELQPARVPLPRRNWQPREDEGKYWSTPKTTDSAPTTRRRPHVDLSEATLAVGRARSIAKRSRKCA